MSRRFRWFSMRRHRGAWIPTITLHTRWGILVLGPHIVPETEPPKEMR